MQDGVSFVEFGDGRHDFIVDRFTCSIFKLHLQICQFLRMGSVVAYHILHQRQKFVYGRIGIVVIYAGLAAQILYNLLASILREIGNALVSINAMDTIIKNLICLLDESGFL